jgi:hypothetical protein
VRTAAKKNGNRISQPPLDQTYEWERTCEWRIRQITSDTFASLHQHTASSMDPDNKKSMTDRKLQQNGLIAFRAGGLQIRQQTAALCHECQQTTP